MKKIVLEGEYVSEYSKIRTRSKTRRKKKQSKFLKIIKKLLKIK